MMRAVPLPVTIVAGFLGAGKTTLVNELLRRPGEQRFGVLVNDFGSLNIDAALIAVESSDEIALTNGCICCTIQDDLAAAVVKLARSSSAVTHIVVECSGVSHPGGVLRVFSNPVVACLAEVRSAVAVVDTSNFELLGYRDSELVIDQAALSDLVILNKRDLVQPGAVQKVRETVLGAQPRACFIEASHCAIPRDLVLPIERAGCNVASELSAAADYEVASQRFETFGLIWDSAVALDEFRRFSDNLPSSILRAKAVLCLAAGASESPCRGVFQQVGARRSLTIEDGPPPAQTQFVLIAHAGSVHPGTLLEAAACCPGARLAPQQQWRSASKASLFAALRAEHTSQKGTT